MSFIDTFMYGVGRFSLGVSELLNTPPQSYCVLNTSDDEFTLSADDGSLVSVILLDGNLSMVGADRFDDIIDTLNLALSSNMSVGGHAVQIVMNNDPKMASREIKSTLDQAAFSARNSRMDIDGLLDDWLQALSGHCSEQKIWVVMWTFPGALTSAEKRKALFRRAKSSAASPFSASAMRSGNVITALHNLHNGIVSSVDNALMELEMSYELMTAHDVLRDIRLLLYPSQTNSSWQPRLPGDKLPVRTPEPLSSNGDYSHMLYPKIGEQLFPDMAEDVGTLSLIDGVYHAPIVMTMPPLDLKPFNRLYRTLSGKKNMPWRISMLIDGGGMDSVPIKSVLASILHFASSDNKKINKALDELRDSELNGDSLVRLRVSLDSWSEDEEQAKIYRGELLSAIQSWGGCDGTGLIGDPLLGVSSTLPAFMKSSPAVGAVAPLKDALSLMPIGRPASPWRSGGIPTRTKDGKLIPINLMSSLQNAWVDIGAAPMGFGKSVWLGVQNLMFCLQPRLDSLPFLSIVDIGPSSRGLINLLKTALPDDLKHQAAYYRLRMEKEYAINPCDLPLGNIMPLPSHKSFLVNLFVLFATPIGKATVANEAIPGIARAAIEAAYDDLSPERNPKKWNRGTDVEVDKYVDELGLHVDNLTWWDIVDACFDSGEIHMASRAQRYAVPLVSDIGGMAQRDLVSGIYKDKTAGGVGVAEYFWRQCVDAIRAYPILAVPTAFDIGDARVVALDLDEVAPKGGDAADRQSGIMYMLARHVVGARLFQMPADVNSMPDRYKAYHTANIERIREQPKRLSYDEFHRVSTNPAIASQIVGDIEIAVRESRKWNLSIGLYSQSLRDFPDILIELASSVYVLGVGTDEEAESIADRFGLSSVARLSIKKIRKPNKDGASMLAFIKTSKGNLEQLLTNTLGPQAIWAFSTTTEDATVRDYLYSQIGVNNALKLLASKYPGGVKAELDSIVARLAGEGGDEALSGAEGYCRALGLI
jgi:intracellular multiplication protein IcmB